MRHSSLLVRTLTVALLGAPLTAVGPPAAAQSPYPSEVRIQELSTNKVVYNTPVYIRGQVAYTNDDGDEYAAEGTVVLEQRYLGSATWTPVATDVMTGFFPVFDFRVVATRNSEFRANYAGDETCAPSTASLVVRVSRKVTGTMTEPREHVYFLSGRVTPDYSGQPVTLMRKRCLSCAWRAYSTHAATATSSYRFRLPLPSSGTYYFRIRVPADASFVKSFSSSWQLTRLF